MMAERGTRKISREDSQAGHCSMKGAVGEGKLLKKAVMTTSSRISPIQRGASRPLGKSRKNTTREAYPSNPTRPAGKARAGKATASARTALAEEVIPKTPSKNEANR